LGKTLGRRGRGDSGIAERVIGYARLWRGREERKRRKRKQERRGGGRTLGIYWERLGKPECSPFHQE
jgi:hypothetical protein